MRKLLQEIGKYLLDISKITFAVAIISPLVKDGSFSVIATVFAGGVCIAGIYTFYKGAKND